jgi:murein DD-endopeptidase MepM/ murein hydrolase activator NlpD
VRSPIDGTVVEARASRGNSGQVFGGTVKVQARDGRVWVFRHVDPKNVHVGQHVGAGERIAQVTSWRDGPSHAHIELWKTYGGGYDFENMLDPMTFLKRFL